MQNDHEVYKRLEILLVQVCVVEQAIADTVIALRQGNTTAAIIFYKTVKMAATQNVPTPLQNPMARQRVQRLP